MNTSTSSKLSEKKENYSELLEKIINDIDNLALTLINKLEEQNPGDILGLSKYELSKKMLSMADELGKNANLDESELMLLKIVLKSHDIGRHKESLDKLDTLRKNNNNKRHGIISVELLKENNILEGLNEEQKQIIYDAVEFHSEKNVVLDKDSLAYKLCYILRDFDKLAIIRDKKYLSVEGIFEQLNKHYFGGKLDGKYLVTINKPIEKTDTETVTRSKEEEKVRKILSKDINPKSLEEFFKMESTTIQDIDYSYSTYMLNTLSMIFDISNNTILKETIYSEMFTKRLKFIEARVDREIFNKIILTITSYITNKLGPELVIDMKKNRILNLI